MVYLNKIDFLLMSIEDDVEGGTSLETHFESYNDSDFTYDTNLSTILENDSKKYPTLYDTTIYNSSHFTNFNTFLSKAKELDGYDLAIEDLDGVVTYTVGGEDNTDTTLPNNKAIWTLLNEYLTEGIVLLPTSQEQSNNLLDEENINEENLTEAINILPNNGNITFTSNGIEVTLSKDESGVLTVTNGTKSVLTQAVKSNSIVKTNEGTIDTNNETLTINSDTSNNLSSGDEDKKKSDAGEIAKQTIASMTALTVDQFGIKDDEGNDVGTAERKTSGTIVDDTEVFTYSNNVKVTVKDVVKDGIDIVKFTPIKLTVDDEDYPLSEEVVTVDSPLVKIIDGDIYVIAQSSVALVTISSFGSIDYDSKNNTLTLTFNEKDEDYLDDINVTFSRSGSTILYEDVTRSGNTMKFTFADSVDDGEMSLSISKTGVSTVNSTFTLVDNATSINFQTEGVNKVNNVTVKKYQKNITFTYDGIDYVYETLQFYLVDADAGEPLPPKLMLSNGNEYLGDLFVLSAGTTTSLTIEGKTYYQRNSEFELSREPLPADVGTYNFKIEVIDTDGRTHPISGDASFTVNVTNTPVVLTTNDISLRKYQSDIVNYSHTEGDSGDDIVVTLTGTNDINATIDDSNNTVTIPKVKSLTADTTLTLNVNDENEDVTKVINVNYIQQTVTFDNTDSNSTFSKNSGLKSIELEIGDNYIQDMDSVSFNSSSNNVTGNVGSETITLLSLISNDNRITMSNVTSSDNKHVVTLLVNTNTNSNINGILTVTDSNNISSTKQYNITITDLVPKLVELPTELQSYGIGSDPTLSFNIENVDEDSASKIQVTSDASNVTLTKGTLDNKILPITLEFNKFISSIDNTEITITVTDDRDQSSNKKFSYEVVEHNLTLTSPVDLTFSKNSGLITKIVKLDDSYLGTAFTTGVTISSTNDKVTVKALEVINDSTGHYYNVPLSFSSATKDDVVTILTVTDSVTKSTNSLSLTFEVEDLTPTLSSLDDESFSIYSKPLVSFKVENVDETNSNKPVVTVSDSTLVSVESSDIDLVNKEMNVTLNFRELLPSDVGSGTLIITVTDESDNSATTVLNYTVTEKSLDVTNNNYSMNYNITDKYVLLTYQSDDIKNQEGKTELKVDIEAVDTNPTTLGVVTITHDYVNGTIIATLNKSDVSRDNVGEYNYKFNVTIYNDGEEYSNELTSIITVINNTPSLSTVHDTFNLGKNVVQNVVISISDVEEFNFTDSDVVLEGDGNSMVTINSIIGNDINLSFIADDDSMNNLTSKTFNLDVFVKDGDKNSNTVNLTFNVTANQPSLTVSDFTANKYQTTETNITVTDADADEEVTLSLTLPEVLVDIVSLENNILHGIDKSTKLLVTNPSPEHVGEHDITVKATDKSNLSSEQTIKLEIVNNPITAVYINGETNKNHSMFKNTEASFTLTLDDDDNVVGNLENYEWVKPDDDENVVFTLDGTTLTVKPRENKVFNESTYTVSVSDANGSSTKTTLVLTVTNQDPSNIQIGSLTYISNSSTALFNSSNNTLTMDKNTQATLQLSVEDNDVNESLIWSSTTLPTNVELTGNNTEAQLNFTPELIGTYNFSVTVKDTNDSSLTLDFTLVVNEHEPVVVANETSVTLPQGTTKGVVFEITDNDFKNLDSYVGELTYSLTNTNELGESGPSIISSALEKYNKSLGLLTITYTIDGASSSVSSDSLNKELTLTLTVTSNENNYVASTKYTITDNSPVVKSVQLNDVDKKYNLVDDSLLFYNETTLETVLNQIDETDITDDFTSYLENLVKVPLTDIREDLANLYRNGVNSYNLLMNKNTKAEIVVNVEDLDLLYNSNERLTFTLENNDSWVSLDNNQTQEENVVTQKIILEPTTPSSSSFLVNVTDINGNNVSVEINVYVINRKPMLSNEENTVNMYKGESKTLQYTLTDYDIINGEEHSAVLYHKVDLSWVEAVETDFFKLEELMIMPLEPNKKLVEINLEPTNVNLGTHEFKLVVTDSNESFVEKLFTVNVDNHLPRIVSVVDNTTVLSEIDNKYSLQMFKNTTKDIIITVEDLDLENDNEILTWSLDGSEILSTSNGNQQSYTLTLTPEVNDLTLINKVITVTDNNNQSVTINVEVEVLNREPFLVQNTTVEKIFKGQTVTLEFTLTDLDLVNGNETHDIKLFNNDNDSEITFYTLDVTETDNTKQLVLSLSPTKDDLGNYNMKLQAIDSNNSVASSEFMVEILDNSPRLVSVKVNDNVLSATNDVYEFDTFKQENNNVEIIVEDLDLANGNETLTWLMNNNIVSVTENGNQQRFNFNMIATNSDYPLIENIVSVTDNNSNNLSLILNANIKNRPLTRRYENLIDVSNVENRPVVENLLNLVNESQVDIQFEMYKRLTTKYEIVFSDLDANEIVNITNTNNWVNIVRDMTHDTENEYKYLVEFNPQSDLVGTDNMIVVEFEDSNGSKLIYNFNVTVLNSPVTIEPISEQSFDKYSQHQFTYEFNDNDDNETFTYSLDLVDNEGNILMLEDNGLEQMNLDSVNKTITLIANEVAVGKDLNLRLTIIDENNESSSEIISIKVLNNVPDAIIFSDNNIVMSEGELRLVTLTAHDLDETNYSSLEELKWYVGDENSWEQIMGSKILNYMTITVKSDTELELSLEPGYGVAGNNNSLVEEFRFKVTDNNNTSYSSSKFNVTINDVIPEVVLSANKVAKVDEIIATLSVQIPDCEILVSSQKGYEYNVEKQDSNNYNLSLENSSKVSIDKIIEDVIIVNAVDSTNSISENKEFTIVLVPDYKLFMITEKTAKQFALLDFGLDFNFVNLVILDSSLNKISRNMLSISNGSLVIDLTSMNYNDITHLSSVSELINLQVGRGDETVDTVVNVKIINDNDMDGLNDDEDLDDDNDGINDIDDVNPYDVNSPIKFNGGVVINNDFTNVKFNGCTFVGTQFLDCNFTNALMNDCEFKLDKDNKKVVLSGKINGLRLTEKTKESLENVMFNTKMYEFVQEGVEYVARFKSDCLLTTYSDINGINLKPISLMINIIEGSSIEYNDLQQLRMSPFNLTTSNGIYSIDLMVEGTTSIQRFEGRMLILNTSEYTHKDVELMLPYVKFPTNYERYIFVKDSEQKDIPEGVGIVSFNDELNLFVDGFGQFNLKQINPDTGLLTNNIGTKFTTTSNLSQIIDNNGSKLGLSQGSFVTFPVPIFKNHTIDFNTYSQPSYNLEDMDILKYSNINNIDLIDSIELSLPNGLSSYDVVDNNGSVINTVVLSNQGSVSSISLLKTSTCQFNLNVKIVLNDIYEANEDGKLVNYVINGSLTFNAEYLRVRGVTLGDPHITTVSGKTYELPNKVTNYRLLQAGDLIVNVSTRKLTYDEGEEIKQYYRKVTNRLPPKSLVTNGVVYDRVIVMYKNSKLNFSFTKDTMQQIGREIQLHNKHTCKISDPKLGEIVLKFKFLKNPQEKYGIEIETNKSNKLDGLLVKEYIASSMEVNNLLDRSMKQGKLGINRVLTKVTNH